MKAPIDQIERHLGPVILALIGTEAKRATKFLSPKWIISAHRISYKGKLDRRETNIDIRIKIGRPNYHERTLVEELLKAEVPFPVRKIRLAYFRA